MEKVSERIIVAYIYDSEFEMNFHKEKMIRDGWFPTAQGFELHAMEYSKRVPHKSILKV